MKFELINGRGFNIMVNKRAAYRVVRPAVDVPAVGALAVSGSRGGGFGELEGGVGADVLNVVRGLRLVRVGIHGQRVLRPVDAHC